MGKEIRRLMFYINTKGTAKGKIWIDNLKLNAVPSASKSSTSGEKTAVQQPIAFFFPGSGANL